MCLCDVYCRKKLELEKARIHLEAIARQTSSWPQTHSHLNYPVSRSLEDLTSSSTSRDYEQPVNTSSDAIYSSVSRFQNTFLSQLPVTSEITAGDVILHEKRSHSVDSTPASLRSASLSNHYCVSNLLMSTHMTSSTPPLMCSTPGSPRDVAPASGFSFDSSGSSVRSTRHSPSGASIQEEEEDEEKLKPAPFPSKSRPPILFSTFKSTSQPPDPVTSDSAPSSSPAVTSVRDLCSIFDNVAFDSSENSSFESVSLEPPPAFSDHVPNAASQVFSTGLDESQSYV